MTDIALKNNGFPTYAAESKRTSRLAERFSAVKTGITNKFQAAAQMSRAEKWDAVKTFSKTTGVKAALRSSASAVAIGVGSGAIPAVLAGSMAVTTYSAYQDYKKAQNIETKGVLGVVKALFSRAFLGFLLQNKKQYGSALVIGSVVGSLGTGDAHEFMKPYLEMLNPLGTAEAADLPADSLKLVSTEPVLNPQLEALPSIDPARPETPEGDLSQAGTQALPPTGSPKLNEILQTAEQPIDDVAEDAAEARTLAVLSDAVLDKLNALNAADFADPAQDKEKFDRITHVLKVAQYGTEPEDNWAKNELAAYLTQKGVAEKSLEDLRLAENLSSFVYHQGTDAPGYRQAYRDFSGISGLVTQFEKEGLGDQGVTQLAKAPVTHDAASDTLDRAVERMVPTPEPKILFAEHFPEQVAETASAAEEAPKTPDLVSTEAVYDPRQQLESLQASDLQNLRDAENYLALAQRGNLGAMNTIATQLVNPNNDAFNPKLAIALYEEIKETITSGNPVGMQDEVDALLKRTSDDLAWVKSRWDHIITETPEPINPLAAPETQIAENVQQQATPELQNTAILAPDKNDVVFNIKESVVSIPEEDGVRYNKDYTLTPYMGDHVVEPGEKIFAQFTDMNGQSVRSYFQVPENSQSINGVEEILDVPGACLTSHFDQSFAAASAGETLNGVMNNCHAEIEKSKGNFLTRIFRGIGSIFSGNGQDYASVANDNDASTRRFGPPGKHAFRGAHASLG